jgi:hypothetical protein
MPMKGALDWFNDFYRDIRPNIECDLQTELYDGSDNFRLRQIGPFGCLFEILNKEPIHETEL